MRLSSRLALPTLLLIAGGARLAAADGAGTDYWVRVMPELWVAKLGGDFSFQRGGGSPTKLDADQLGIDGNHNTFAIEAGAQVPFLFGFHAGYSAFKTDGSATLTQNVTYGSQTFTAASTVETHAKLNDLWGEICVRPLNLDLVGFSVGVAGHSLGAEMTLRDTGSGQQDSFKKTVFIPAGALRAHVTPVLGVTIEARLHYIELGLGGDHARYVSAALQASYRPITWVGILAGYRYDLFDIHLKDPSGSNSSADTNLSLSGPYAGLIAKF
jgi:hypothetical protein